MTNDSDELRKTRNAIENGQMTSRYVATWTRVAVNIAILVRQNRLVSPVLDDT